MSEGPDDARTGEAPDNANVVIRPPIAWALAVAAGLALDWLHPLRLMPWSIVLVLFGVLVFALALVLLLWAVMTIREAGSHVETHLPTTRIVHSGPYRFSRNPIYLAMMLGLVGLSVAFNSLWVLAMLVPFFLVIRYGVVAREEAYLERKFGDLYRLYRSRVRRWL
jgi:protein-S-isoprenylcysteine O-methyltransferase Ste14